MKPIQRGSKAETTPLFWDCECPQKFIHPKSVDRCKKCLKTKEESPDSRLDEVCVSMNRAVNGRGK